jgi:hypothetical protein
MTVMLVHSGTFHNVPNKCYINTTRNPWHKVKRNITRHWNWTGSRDSVVSVATRYWLGGPGIESRWGEIFRTYPDRLRGPPSLLYNGYRVFPEGKGGRGVMLTTHPLLERVQLYLHSPHGYFWACYGSTFTLLDGVGGQSHGPAALTLGKTW